MDHIFQISFQAPVPVYGSTMRRLYSLYTGTGSVYVVLAQSLTGVSAYVPAVSYGCSAVFFTDSCSVLCKYFINICLLESTFSKNFPCMNWSLFFSYNIFQSLVRYCALSWTLLMFCRPFIL